MISPSEMDPPPAPNHDQNPSDILQYWFEETPPHDHLPGDNNNINYDQTILEDRSCNLLDNYYDLEMVDQVEYHNYIAREFQDFDDDLSLWDWCDIINDDFNHVTTTGEANKPMEVKKSTRIDDDGSWYWWDDLLGCNDDDDDLKQPLMVDHLHEAPQGNSSCGGRNRKQQQRRRSPLSLEEIEKHFEKPIAMAAKELNVGLTVLKKRCRELNINRWPHRKLRSLKSLIQNLKEMGLKEEMEILEEHKRLIEKEPEMELTQKTKKLRQACYKSNYKKRRLLIHLNQNQSLPYPLTIDQLP